MFQDTHIVNVFQNFFDDKTLSIIVKFIEKPPQNFKNIKIEVQQNPIQKKIFSRAFNK